jgi:hypothetical protein
MKTIIFTIALCSVMLFGVSCSNDNLSVDDSTQARLLNSSGEEESQNLAGTSWKLDGIVDVETNEITVLEPKECNTCYTLKFDSDTTATGKSVMNEICLLITSSSTRFGMTKIWDGENNNVNLFYEALQTLDTTYEYNEEELKLYFDEKTKYLLFKPWLQTVTDDEIIPFDEYHLEPGASCRWTLLEPDTVGGRWTESKEDEVVVINSDEEFKQYVICTGDDYPAIDFSKYTILLANGVGTNCVISADCNSCQKLSEHNYQMNVDVRLGLPFALSYWQVPIIINKLSEGCNIELVVRTMQYQQL